jgi:hypothetical protein
MDTRLRTAIDLIPVIQSLTYGEASIAVTDRQMYLADVPGKRIDFHIAPGDPLKEGGTAREAIERGQLISRQQPAAVFGVPYLAHTTPIRDEDGMIIGSMAIRLPLHLEEELSKMAVSLASAMTQFNGTFQEIASVAENTAQAATRLSSAAEHMDSVLKETETVTRAIVKVSDRTHLLGLNAMIEAAHAGGAGAGFGVVAREIQSLSQRSLKATEDTTRSLKSVSVQNEVVISETQSLQADSENLHAQVEECLAIVESLTSMAEKLRELAARAEAIR